MQGQKVPLILKFPPFWKLNSLYKSIYNISSAAFLGNCCKREAARWNTAASRRMNRRCALTIELPETNTFDKSLLRRLNFL